MIIDKLKDKKIVILGFGREGKSSLSYIRKYLPNQLIAIADDNIENIKIEDKNVCKCSKNYINELDEYDIILKSPGIPVKNHKYDAVLDKISSQTDLFIEEYSNQIVGVTGTKGKSTTSSLIYHVLKKSGIDTILAGNIGIPVFDIIDDIHKDTVIILELSSHQLEFVHASPRIGLLLNIYEEHLDHYDSFVDYQNCKKNIFRHMNKDDLLIYNIENDYLKYSEIEHIKNIKISNNPLLNCPVYVADKIIHYNGKLLDLNGKNIKLLGDHNYLNILFAYVVSKQLGLSDVQFISALEDFNPLPHRMEYIGQSKSGNKFYNDSISTIPEATIKAIESIDNIKTVIIGGMDRGINYKKLINFIPNSSIENVILLPDSGLRIKKDLDNVPNSKKLILAGNMEEAVNIADKITKNGGVLLSPAAASYGVYKNFEERGNHFKECFNKLK